MRNYNSMLHQQYHLPTDTWHADHYDPDREKQAITDSNCSDDLYHACPLYSIFPKEQNLYEGLSCSVVCGKQGKTAS